MSSPLSPRPCFPSRILGNSSAVPTTASDPISELGRVSGEIERMYDKRQNGSFTAAELARYRLLVARERELRLTLGLDRPVRS